MSGGIAPGPEPAGGGNQPQETDTDAAPPLLRVDHLTKRYRTGLQVFKGPPPAAAVDDVSFQVRAGETLGLVGESGSGKTTVGRLLLRLETPDSGKIFFDGEDWLALSGSALARRRREVQVIFQDPQTSLNPRMTVGDQIAEPLRVQKLVPRRELRDRVATLLKEVGLSPDAASRFPVEFSGGQRQRVAIARALATRPRFLVCDEPVSSLDVSVAAQIINLLIELRESNDLSMLFISHDLGIVLRLADRVAVMYRGRIVEEGRTDLIASHPLHPYTTALLSAAAGACAASDSRIVLSGDPSEYASGEGCPFHPRCPIARPRCRHEFPPRVEQGSQASAACFFPGELALPAGVERRV